MKMLILILTDGGADEILRGLIEAGFRVTRLASSGGFLRRGNTTLLLGMPAEKLDEALALVRRLLAAVGDPGSQRGTAFVLDVAQYEQL